MVRHEHDGAQWIFYRLETLPEQQLLLPRRLHLRSIHPLFLSWGRMFHLLRFLFHYLHLIERNAKLQNREGLVSLREIVLEGLECKR